MQSFRGSALPSPERLPAAQGFGRRGFAQADLKPSYPPVCSVFQNTLSLAPITALSLGREGRVSIFSLRTLTEIENTD